MKKCWPASQTSPPSTVPGAVISASSGNHSRSTARERRHLSGAARGAWAGEDRAPGGDDGGILDEGGVGKVGIGGEPDEGESQPLQRPAVGVVLLQRERQVRRAEAGRGDPGGEGGGGGTDDGTGESHR